jgi:Tol biopolymer transport system component
MRTANDEIYFMNADGTDPTRLTFNPATDNAAAWSPDGQKILFQSARDGNVEIRSRIRCR